MRWFDVDVSYMWLLAPANPSVCSDFKEIVCAEALWTNSKLLFSSVYHTHLHARYHLVPRNNMLCGQICDWSDFLFLLDPGFSLNA